jgi:3-hydroxy acid dehydrogenase/malonic semialdehyde reductase
MQEYTERGSKFGIKFKGISKLMKNIIVITGASSGIGAETARKFSSEGYPVALLARREDKLQDIADSLTTPAFVFPVDIRAAQDVSRIIDEIEKKYGPIEVLVNNAGGAFGLDKAQEAKLDDWDLCVDTNIKGLLYATHAVLPHFVTRNCGHIINIGSIAGTYAYPGGNVYGAAKAFVHHFSRNLKADLLGYNIRVSCIEPGLTTGSEFSLVRFKGDEDKANSVYANTHPLHAKDIAEAIFFCHQLPSHINVNTMEIMPVGQASAALAVHRTT